MLGFIVCCYSVKEHRVSSCGRSIVVFAGHIIPLQLNDAHTASSGFLAICKNAYVTLHLKLYILGHTERDWCVFVRLIDATSADFGYLYYSH